MLLYPPPLLSMKKVIKIAVIAVVVVVIVGLGSGIASEARNDSADQGAANVCYDTCVAQGNDPYYCASHCSGDTVTQVPP